MVSYLLSLLFSGPARDPDREEIEETRRAVVAEAQMLAEPQRAALAFSVSRVLGSIRLLPRALLLPR